MSGEAWQLRLQWNNVWQNVEAALLIIPPCALERSFPCFCALIAQKPNVAPYGKEPVLAGSGMSGLMVSFAQGTAGSTSRHRAQTWHHLLVTLQPNILADLF
jgi:hypothetical protein